jgi:hypothetical protein
MGTTQVDKSCEDGAIGQRSVCVLFPLRKFFTDSITAIAIYGVLFMDWNQEEGAKRQPFQGVRCMIAY